MSHEVITLLVLGTVALAVPQAYGLDFIRQNGVPAWLGNREGDFRLDGWAGRAKRAHANLVENLVPFALAVVAAQALSVSNEITAGASAAFLISRLVHLVSYVAGVKVVRTLAYNAGVLATFAFVGGVVWG